MIVVEAVVTQFVINTFGIVASSNISLITWSL